MTVGGPILMIPFHNMGAGAIIGGIFAAMESETVGETLLGVLGGLAVTVIGSLLLIEIVAGLGILFENTGSASLRVTGKYS